MLTRNIVVKINNWESCPVIGRGRIGWRTGDAVAKHIRYDYEVFAWIQRLSFTNYSLIMPVLTTEEGGKHHHIILVGVQLPIGLVSQFRADQSLPRLQNQVSKLEYLVI